MEIEEIKENYQKYKWFYTSSGKLVIGGKSSTQNEELLKSLKKQDKDFIVMHTASPGSPFSVIISDIKRIKKKDIEEAAIFTGCFSRAWREKKKKTIVDIFKLSQLYKTKGMKTGTWGVRGDVKKISVELKLVLIKQKGKLRAVPEKTAKKKEILLRILPGKIDKKNTLPKLQVELEEFFNEAEILSAFPAGGVRVSNKK